MYYCVLNNTYVFLFYCRKITLWLNFSDLRINADVLGSYILCGRSKFTVFLGFMLIQSSRGGTGVTADIARMRHTLQMSLYMSLEITPCLGILGYFPTYDTFPHLAPFLHHLLNPLLQIHLEVDNFCGHGPGLMSPRRGIKSWKPVLTYINVTYLVLSYIVFFYIVCNGIWKFYGYEFWGVTNCFSKKYGKFICI